MKTPVLTHAGLLIFLILAFFQVRHPLCAQDQTVKIPLSDSTLVIRLFQRGLAFYNDGKYQAAIDTAAMAFDMACRLDGDSLTIGRYIASSANVLRFAHLALNHLDEAKYYGHLTLDLRRRFLPPSHPSLATALSGLAQVYLATGDLSTAVSYAEQHLEFNLRLYGNTPHLQTAKAKSELGDLYSRTGRMQAAMELLNSALEILDAIGQTPSMDAITALTNRGTLHGNLGNFKEQLADDERVLTMFLELGFPEDHPKLGSQFLNLANTYNQLGQYQKALEYHYKALENFAKNFPPESLQNAYAHLSISATLSNLNAFDQAISNARKGLEILQAVFPADHPNIAYGFHLLGYRYLDIGDLDLAITNIKEALRIRILNYGEKGGLVGASAGLLGLAYLHRGDYYLALHYHRKQLEIAVLENGPNSGGSFYPYINIGSILAQSGDPDGALPYFNKAIEIGTTFFGHDNPDTWLARFYASNAQVQNGSMYPDDLLALLEQARRIFPPGHAHMIEAQKSLAEAFISKKQFQKAILSLEEGIALIKNNRSLFSPGLAQLWFLKASAHQEMGDPLLTISYCDSAITALKLPKPNINESISDPQILAQVLRLKGQALLSLARNTPSFLEAARNTFNAGIKLINQEFHNLSSPESKKVFMKVAEGMYEGAIEAALWGPEPNAAELEQAFSASEQSRALVLFEAMQENKAALFAGIPDSVLRLEAQLKSLIGTYSRKRDEAFQEGRSEQDSVVIFHAMEIFKYQRKLDSLKLSLHLHYPEYYRLKYQLQPQTIAEIQAGLKPEECLVEYFTGDSAMYCFVVKKGEVKAVRLPNNFPLSQWVEAIQNSITAMGEAQTAGTSLQPALEIYASIADSLYQKLLGPIQPLLTAKMTIIPSGVLNYLPFEALLKGQPERLDRMHTYPYLLNYCQISYCYSATLLREMQAKTHAVKPTRNLIAFAPFANGDTTIWGVLFPEDLGLREGFQPLPYSGPEVLRAVDLVGGYAFLGPKATKKLFQELAPEYRIIHLATHARADDRIGDYSFLLFSEATDKIENKFLFSRDLYTMRLNTDLVVLSACESGRGELQEGEGIISLARAFAFAGAKSMLTSLWNVSDEHTADLMVRFYKYLKSGIPKHEALRLAKADYLKDNKGPLALPFYWAAFILIGDMSPVLK